MRSICVSLLLVPAILAGCASPAFGPAPGEDVLLIPADGLLEVGLDASGGIVEVEYHCQRDDVPQAVLRAVEAVVPGGDYAGFEKEYHGAELFYDVAKIVDGRQIDVMVTAAGQVVGREIEVPESGVPDVVLEAAAKAVPGSIRTGIEEVRDGANNLVEYQIKSTRSDIAYKCVLSPAGDVLRLLRETPAEIEVPIAR